MGQQAKTARQTQGLATSARAATHGTRWHRQQARPCRRMPRCLRCCNNTARHKRSACASKVPGARSPTPSRQCRAPLLTRSSRLRTGHKGNTSGMRSPSLCTLQPRVSCSFALCSLRIDCIWKRLDQSIGRHVPTRRIMASRPPDLSACLSACSRVR